MKRLFSLLCALLIMVSGVWAYTAVTSITSGSYYRFHSDDYSTLSMADMGGTVSGVTTDEGAYNQIWKVTKNGSSYTIQNVLTEKYIQVNPGRSTQFTTASSSSSFTTVNTSTDSDGNTIFAFGTTGYNYLHCASSASYNVVGWTNSSASYWELEKVTLTDSQLATIATLRSNFVTIESGKYYRLHNYAYPTLDMTETNGLVTGTKSSASLYNQVWKLTKSGSNYTFQNLLTENYIKDYPGTSSQFSTTTAASAFPVTTFINDNKISFAFGNGYNCMHCSQSQSYNVVGWTVNADATKWNLEEVTVTDEDLAAIADIKKVLNNSSLYTNVLKLFFSDYACTTLNDTYAAMTDDELRSKMSYLPSALQEMAVNVKNNTWNSEKDATYNAYEKDFRIHDYDIWSNCGQWRNVTKIGPFSHLFHPTGIQATAGSTIFLFVGDNVKDSDASLEVEFVAGTNQTGSTVTLTRGCNAVYVPMDCEIFISYLLNNTSKLYADYPDITVHIEGGTCTGCFDMQRGHTDTDWDWLRTNMFTGTYLHVKGHDVMLNVKTERVTKEDSPVNVMRVWDFIFRTLQSLAGCDQWKKAGTYKMMTNPFYNENGGNPYWSSYGSSHPDLSSSNVFSSYQLRNVGTDGGAIWVIEHELGHGHQGPINMAGLTESSNNSLAQMVNLLTTTATDQYGKIFDTTRSSRAGGVAELVNRFNGGYSWIDMGSQRTGSDLWVSNRMYFQLWMYFDLLKHYQPETNDGFAFMSALFDALRADPLVQSTNPSNPNTSANDWLKVAKYAAQITQTDLSEFFDVWGFWELEPTITNTNDDTTNKVWFFGDYSNKYVKTAQQYVDEVRTAMQAYETKAPNLMFIEDRCVGSTLATYNNASVESFGETGYYETFDDEITGNYAYNITGTKVTMGGGEGAVGYKIYDADGNLVYIANTNSFNVSETIAEGLNNGTYTLKAAQGDGADYAASYDPTIGVFPLPNTWYTLSTPLRDARYMLSNGVGSGVAGTAQATPTDAMKWQFVIRDDGSYDIVNKGDGSYLSPTASWNAQISTTSSEPSAGWMVDEANTDGLYIIYSGSIQINQTNNSGTGGYKVYNWGGGSNKSDAGCQYAIEEAADDLSSTVLAEIAGKNVSVTSTSDESLTPGQWYVMYDRGRPSYVYENDGALYGAAALPSGNTTEDICSYLVRFIEDGTGKYYVQNGYGNYFWRFQHQSQVVVTSQKSERITVGNINSTAGHYYLQSVNTSVIFDTNGAGYTVAGWSTTVPSSTGGNNDWALYPVELYTLGDVNNDGIISIADVTALVNIILGKDNNDNKAADVNQDSQISIADVTALVNIILEK